jgi:hypothetical protein
MKKAALILPILFALLNPVRAELLIYELNLNQTGTTVNYQSIPGGYVVVDHAAQTFSSVMILSDPDTNQPYYVTDLLSGSYIELSGESGGNFAVMSSFGGTSESGESVAFQVIGKTSGDTDVGPGVSLRVAKKLKGYFLANGEEVISTDEDGEATIEYGFAGSSKATAKFDSGSTQFANDSKLTSSAAITAITTALENNGIGPEPTPTPSPTPSPTPGPTP